MQTMTIVRKGHVFRWAGGSFVPVWKEARADEHVPDDMIELPDSLTKARATREDIERIADEWLVAA